MTPADLRALADIMERVGPETLRGLLADSPAAPVTPGATRPPRRRQGPPKRPRPPEAEGEGEGEAVGLVRQLVAKFGTQTAVGQALGLNPKLLSAWACGENCSPGSLARLREGLRHPAPPLERAAG